MSGGVDGSYVPGTGYTGEAWATVSSGHVAETNFGNDVDTLEGAQGTDRATAYDTDFSAPRLTPAQENLNNIFEEPIFDETNSVLSFAYGDSYAENVAELAEKYSLSEDQIRQLIAYSMTGEIPEDPQFASYLQELDGMIASDMAEVFELPSYSDQKRAANEYVSRHKGRLANLKERINQMPEGEAKQAALRELEQAESELETFQNAVGNASSREELSGAFSNHLESLSEHEILSTYLGDSVDEALSLRDGVQLTAQIEKGDFSFFKGDISRTFMETAGGFFAQSFEAQLEGMDPEKANQLRYAFYNPEYAGDNPELEQLKANAIASMGSGWGLPEGYYPAVDNTRFNAGLENGYQGTFEGLLDKTDLSEADKNLLMYYYFSGSSFEGNTRLEGIANDLQAQAMAQHGIPSNAKPPLNPFYYTSVFEGSVMQSMIDKITQLPPEQQQAVLLALKDPLNPNISPETKALIDQMFNQSAAEVRQMHNLPASWNPSIEVLSALPNVNPAMITALGDIAQLESDIAMMRAYVMENMSGPEQQTYLDILDALAEMTILIKEMTARLLILDSQMAKEMSLAELKQSQSRLDLKIEENKKIQEKRDKQKKGPGAVFMKIFKAIAIAFMAAMVPFLGPIAAIVCALLIISLIVELATGKDYLAKGLEMYFKLVQKVFSFLPEPGASVMATLCEAALVVAVAIATGNVVVGVMLLSQTITNTCVRFAKEVCGASEMAAAVVGMVVGAIVAIAAIAVTFGTAAGQILAAKMARGAAKVLSGICRGLAKVVKPISNGLAQRLTNMADRFTRVAARLDDALNTVEHARKGSQAFKEGMKQIKEMLNSSAMLWGMRAMEAGRASFQAATTVVQVQNSLIARDIAKIRESYVEIMAELEAAIKALKELRDRLMEIITGMSAYNVDVEKDAQRRYRDMSSTLDTLGGAV